MPKNKIPTIKSTIEALRPIQWIKNLSLFAALILNGQLLNNNLFLKSFWAFIVFCLL
jgi:4-hydroxybenzoate polyprenyltransferase